MADPRTLLLTSQSVVMQNGGQQGKKGVTNSTATGTATAAQPWQHLRAALKTDYITRHTKGAAQPASSLHLCHSCCDGCRCQHSQGRRCPADSQGRSRRAGCSQAVHQGQHTSEQCQGARLVGCPQGDWDVRQQRCDAECYLVQVQDTHTGRKRGAANSGKRSTTPGASTAVSAMAQRVGTQGRTSLLSCPHVTHTLQLPSHQHQHHAILTRQKPLPPAPHKLLMKAEAPQTQLT